MPICALCHGPGPLRNSHVMPELMYGPLYEPDDHRFHHVDVETGETRIMQKGLREKLFCATCESPLLSDLERRYSQDVEIPDEMTGSQLTLNVDYGQVKLCLLSILWRAGISSLDAFSEGKRSVPMQRGAWRCVGRVYRVTELACGRSEGAGWL